MAFKYNMLLTEFMWQNVGIIPKSNGRLKGIGLVEVLCKALSVVINW